MAKTIEQLEQEQVLAANILKRAQTNFATKNNALIKARKAEEAKVTMTLALALEAEVPSGWNARGDAFLTQLSFKGDWKGTGLRNGMGHWGTTKQSVLTIGINHTWDDAQLLVTATLLQQVVPLIRPGQLEGTLKLMSKGSSVDSATLRCFDIAESSCKEDGDFKLGQISETEWVVFDQRDVGRSWGRARITGSLMECLQEIRSNLWSSGGHRETEDHCHC